MDYRILGRTGLRVGALGFGCGAVGGLMVRGAPAERTRVVARALELGINYFDTAAQYGDGQSELNLGAVLRELRADVHVGTKVRVAVTSAAEIPAAIAQSLEASLRRLGRERVDLLQLHNPITVAPRPGAVTARDVLATAVPALTRLVEQGKIRFCGITALGDTPALLDVLDAGVLDTAQVCFNLLNPSAGHAVPTGFPGQDFGRLLARGQARRTGTIVIRVLAAGALSGADDRHPVAAPSVAPIATGPDYATDVRRARLLLPLVRDGHAASLIEASLRFTLASDAVSTVLIGVSSLAQFEEAAASVAKGPLGPAALARLPALWEGLAAAA
jgi:aryl-alcohol dehydrogenase-like predicted oxidoreductase